MTALQIMTAGPRVRRLVAGVALLWTAAVHAQAWLPDGGTTSFGATYTDSFVKEHFTPDGHTVDAGHTRVYTYDFAVAYSPTDYWMFNATLPLVSSEYHGSKPHPTEVDNGQYHTTFTDLRLEAHYQLLQEPVALAPYVAYVWPTHDYETLGHAAPGRGLTETWLGLGVGKSLDKWIPRTYVQARFTYAWVEKVAGVSHNRENIDFDVGYYVNAHVALQALMQWQKTIGGIDVPLPMTDPRYPVLFPHHDQLAADDHTNIGGGASWFVSDESTWSLAYMQGVKGRNGHKVDSQVTLAYTYGFFGFRPR